MKQFLAGLACVVAAAADWPVLPLTAPQPDAFVPAGWKIEQQLSADLNADKLLDQALVLLEQAGSGRPEKKPRRLLLVVLASAGQPWQRVGAAQRLLLCQGCFGLLDGAPRLSARQGQLLVSQEAGGRYALALTQRFRYEPAVKRLRFEGEERRITDRTNPDRSASYSTNLLTGRQTVKVFDEALAAEAAKAANRQRTLTLAPLYLEDVNNQDNDAETLPWLPASYDDNYH